MSDEHRTSNLVAELYNYGRGLEDTDRGSLCIRGAREIERLTAELAAMKEADELLAKAFVELKAERDRLRAALERYGTHHQGCPARGENPCCCGFLEAVRAADETSE